MPIWNEKILVNRVKELKNIGAKRVFFKTGPFRPDDLVQILKIASKAKVDLVTFDGAGGGTGNSPVKMMSECGIPTVLLENILHGMLEEVDKKGYLLPPVAITGGIAMEVKVIVYLNIPPEVINL